MRLMPPAHVTNRIARAVTALLASKRSTGEWSRESVDALRRLVRARQAALLVSTEEQQRVFGDTRPSALLRQIPTDPSVAADGEAGGGPDGADAAERPRRDRVVDRTVAAESPDGQARFDMVGLLSPLGEPHGMVGICCTFAPAVSERTAMTRLSLLHAVQPALEAAVRDRMARSARRDALRAMLSAVDDGAALYAGDGTLLDANDALADILAADGAGELLREHMTRAAVAAGGAAPRATEQTTTVRTPHHQYRLRTRRLADPHDRDHTTVLVLVEPLTRCAELPVAFGGAELLQQRFRLTDREYEVVRLLHLGQSNLGVATALGISPNTARHHTERVMMKLGITSRAAIHRVLLELQQQLAVHPGLADRPPLREEVVRLPELREGAPGATPCRAAPPVRGVSVLLPAD